MYVRNLMYARLSVAPLPANYKGPKCPVCESVDVLTDYDEEKEEAIFEDCLNCGYTATDEA